MEMNKENTVAFVGSNTARILSDTNDANLINVLLTETYLLVATLYQQILGHSSSARRMVLRR